MGRPKGIPRSIETKIRWHPQEWDLVVETASEQGVAPSRWVRELAFNQAAEIVNRRDHPDMYDRENG